MLKSLCKKTTALLLVAICTISFASGCSKQAASGDTKQTASNTSTTSTTSTGHPQVQIEMENGGKMVFQLYPEFAPETVSNFISLAEAGFYNGLTFHRIMKDFMVQGGDPEGTGAGGSDKNITGEFSENGFTKNALSHIRGVISMARSQDPNSASSQFFIMTVDYAGLNGKYAAFGVLISGEDTLDEIAATPVKANELDELSVPTKTVKIKSVTVLSK